MEIDRDYVLHKNEEGIPATREITVTGDSDPFVSIIIPTADGYRDGYFPALLKQLESQTFQDFEVITIKGDPRQGRGINTGVAIARGKYILTLDDDTSLESIDAIAIAVDVMEKNLDIGMAGGINKIPENAPPFVKRAMKEIPRRATPEVEKITDSDLAEHPFLIMSKELFKKIGGENELIPRGLDPYLREKFRDAGTRVVVLPKVYYSHLPPATFKKLVRQFFRNGRQAAFANIHFPEWVIETPAEHGEFTVRVPLPIRVARFPIKLCTSLIQGKPIFFTCETAYALGFAVEWLGAKKK